MGNANANGAAFCSSDPLTICGIQCGSSSTSPEQVAPTLHGPRVQKPSPDKYWAPHPNQQGETRTLAKVQASLIGARHYPVDLEDVGFHPNNGNILMRIFTFFQCLDQAILDSQCLTDHAKEHLSDKLSGIMNNALVVGPLMAHLQASVASTTDQNAVVSNHALMMFFALVVTFLMAGSGKITMRAYAGCTSDKKEAVTALVEKAGKCAGFTSNLGLINWNNLASTHVMNNQPVVRQAASATKPSFGTKGKK